MYANQPTPNQMSCWVKRITLLYWIIISLQFIILQFSTFLMQLLLRNPGPKYEALCPENSIQYKTQMVKDFIYYNKSSRYGRLPCTVKKTGNIVTYILYIIGWHMITLETKWTIVPLRNTMLPYPPDFGADLRFLQLSGGMYAPLRPKKTIQHQLIWEEPSKKSFSQGHSENHLQVLCPFRNIKNIVSCVARSSRRYNLYHRTSERHTINDKNHRIFYRAFIMMPIKCKHFWSSSPQELSNIRVICKVARSNSGWVGGLMHKKPPKA